MLQVEFAGDAAWPRWTIRVASSLWRAAGSTRDRLRRDTVGGQGKSGERPARSRHCDRVKEAAGAKDAGHWGDTEPSGRCGRPPRKPGDLSPASHDNPRGKGGFNAKNRSTRLAAACALALTCCSRRRGRVGEGGRAPTCAWSAPAARCSPKRRCRPGTTKVPTSPKATCFGKGTGGSGKAGDRQGRDRARPAGPGGEVDGIAAAAAGDRRLPRRIRPRHLRGRRHQQHREEVLVPEGQPQEPRTRRRIGEAEDGRRSPLGARRVPVPERAGAGSPRRSDPGRAVRGPGLLLRRQGQAQAGSRSDGYRRVRADRAPTGKATVVLSAPTTLVATHGKDIPSNGAAVCVLGVCPKG